MLLLIASVLFVIVLEIRHINTEVIVSALDSSAQDLQHVTILLVFDVVAIFAGLLGKVPVKRYLEDLLRSRKI